MSDYGKTYEHIRGMKQHFDHTADGFMLKMREQAALLTQRFVDAGWSQKEGWWWGCVNVVDPSGNTRRWCIFSIRETGECLDALAEAEAAAEAAKEVR